MAVSDVGREAVVASLKRFDDDLREFQEWSGWERRYSYAIDADGRRYPAKQILSMATALGNRCALRPPKPSSTKAATITASVRGAQALLSQGTETIETIESIALGMGVLWAGRGHAGLCYP